MCMSSVLETYPTRQPLRHAIAFGRAFTMKVYNNPIIGTQRMIAQYLINFEKWIIHIIFEEISRYKIDDEKLFLVFFKDSDSPTRQAKMIRFIKICGPKLRRIWGIHVVGYKFHVGKAMITSRKNINSAPLHFFEMLRNRSFSVGKIF
jgi:hypothetical protein